MPKVLAFTPTYGDGPRPETVAAVAAQRFTGELVHEISWHNPYPTHERDMRNVLAQFQKARQMVLDGDYDALFCVEHDMDIPPDAAQLLYDTDAPVVYAPYIFRHGPNVLSLWQWLGNKNLGMSLSLYPRELAQLRRQGIGPVCGVGFGCTLMRRDVLAKIQFRSSDNAAPDLPFAMDCIRRGIKPLARFDIECGHYHNGVWLWPWRMERGAIVGRIYMLQDVTVNVEGNSVPLKKGRYYSLPYSVRQDLVRAGYGRHAGEQDDMPPARETGAQPQVAAVNPVAETATAPAQAKVAKRKPRKTA